MHYLAEPLEKIAGAYKRCLSVPFSKWFVIMLVTFHTTNLGIQIAVVILNILVFLQHMQEKGKCRAFLIY